MVPFSSVQLLGNLSNPAKPPQRQNLKFLDNRKQERDLPNSLPFRPLLFLSAAGYPATRIS
jgi:hypothetical protein